METFPWAISGLIGILWPMNYIKKLFRRFGLALHWFGLSQLWEFLFVVYPVKPIVIIDPALFLIPPKIRTVSKGREPEMKCWYCGWEGTEEELLNLGLWAEAACPGCGTPLENGSPT